MNNRIVSVVILCLPLFVGCKGEDASASLEGRVVDSAGLPASAVIVTAHQAQPLKGYDRFETTTTSDGSFQFKRLYPHSIYVLSFRGKTWETKADTTIQSAPAGETSLLPEPVVVTFVFNNQGSPVDLRTGRARFIKSSDGVITDTQNGVKWFSPQEQDMSWDSANAWAAGLTVAGGGWRMPTLTELSTINYTGKDVPNAYRHKVPPIFRMGGGEYLEVKWVWSSQQRGTRSAFIYNFQSTEARDYPCSSSFGSLAVRSPKSGAENG